MAAHRPGAVAGRIWRRTRPGQPLGFRTVYSRASALVNTLVYRGSFPCVLSDGNVEVLHLRLQRVPAQEVMVLRRLLTHADVGDDDLGAERSFLFDRKFEFFDTLLHRVQSSIGDPPGLWIPLPLLAYANGTGANRFPIGEQLHVDADVALRVAGGQLMPGFSILQSNLKSNIVPGNGGF